jgi:hypothetical protein
VIARERRVKACLTTTAGTDPVTAKPTLEWHFDEAALAAEAAADGWYALLTNLAPGVSAAEVPRNYKGQETAERRYSNFKGPIAVAPMFLKNNRRIQALISMICLALLIFSLVERAVRLALSPALKLAGLWAGKPAKPTGRLIFVALSRLRLVPVGAAGPAEIPRPRRSRPNSSNCSVSIPADHAEDLQVMNPQTTPLHVLKARLTKMNS